MAGNDKCTKTITHRIPLNDSGMFINESLNVSVGDRFNLLSKFKARVYLINFLEKIILLILQMIQILSQFLLHLKDYLIQMLGH